MAKTGKSSVPGVAQNENISFRQFNKAEKKVEILTSDPDFIMPMSTQMYDLRIKGNNYCEWNEEFIINEKVKEILKPNIIIMFEILDFNTDLIIKNSKLLNSEKFYPVAWAYMRPLGSASVHLEKVKLQLFKFKFNSDEAHKFHRPIDFFTPDVMLELIWPQKTRFNSYLEVEIGFSNRIEETVERYHFSRAPWEKEVALTRYEGAAIKYEKVKAVAEDETMAITLKHKCWEKYLQLPSELPNQLEMKFDSENQGVFKLKFSNAGKYLAVACTLENNKTIVKIFDCEKEKDHLQIILRGHNDLIHDICWSKNDNFLVTASADGSVRVWNMKEKETDSSDRLNY